MKRKSKRRSSLKRKNFYKRSRKIRRTRKRRTNIKKGRRTRKKMAMRGGAGNQGNPLQQSVVEARATAKRVSPTQITDDGRRGSITPDTARQLGLEGFRVSEALPQDLQEVGEGMDPAQAQEAVRDALSDEEISKRVTEEMLGRRGPEALATYGGESLNLAQEQALSQGQAEAEANATTQHEAMVKSTKQVITNLGTRIKANNAQIKNYQEVIKKLISEIKSKTREYEELKSTSTDAAAIGQHVEEIEDLRQQLRNISLQMKDKLIMKEVYKTMIDQIMKKFKETTDNINGLLEQRKEQSEGTTKKIVDNLQKMVQNYIFLKNYVYHPGNCPEDLQTAINEGIDVLNTLGRGVTEDVLQADIQDGINELMDQTRGGTNLIYQDGIRQSVQYLVNQDNSEKLIAQAMQENVSALNNPKIDLAMKVIELESINDLLRVTENEGERQIINDSRVRVIGEIQQLGQGVGGLSQDIQELISAQEPGYVQPVAE